MTLPPPGLCFMLSVDPTFEFAFQSNFCTWMALSPPPANWKGSFRFNLYNPMAFTRYLHTKENWRFTCCYALWVSAKGKKGNFRPLYSGLKKKKHGKFKVVMLLYILFCIWIRFSNWYFNLKFISLNWQQATSVNKKEPTGNFSKQKRTVLKFYFCNCCCCCYQCCCWIPGLCFAFSKDPILEVAFHSSLRDSIWNSNHKK